MRIYLYILLMFVQICAFAQDTIAVSVQSDNVSAIYNGQPTKEMADSAYAKGDYTSAVSIYEALIANEGEAVAVYYNLGNAYYKKNDIAKAILNYERALLLDPSDKDVRFNLELAQSKTIDKVAEKYNIFFMQWLHSAIDALSMKTWCIVGVVAFIVLLSSLLFLFFNNRVAVRKIAFVLSISMLLVTLFANLSAYTHYADLTNRSAAIILSPSVTAKSTPDESGTNLFVIHEGHKVNVTDDTMRNWKEIELEDGTVGWVPASSLELI